MKHLPGSGLYKNQSLSSRHFHFRDKVYKHLTIRPIVIRVENLVINNSNNNIKQKLVIVKKRKKETHHAVRRKKREIISKIFEG